MADDNCLSNPKSNRITAAMYRLFPSLSLALVFSILAQSGAAAAEPVMVSMETTKGSILIELLPEKAPKSVENFLQYVRDGFYEGTIFHRVIPGFMVQGGGFDSELNKKQTRSPIANEAANGLLNDHYTIAMARLSSPNSATSQFFINTVDNAGLNRPNPDGHGYAVFGKVVDGFEIVDAIEKSKTGVGSNPANPGVVLSDFPLEPIVIESVTILSGDE